MFSIHLSFFVFVGKRLFGEGYTGLEYDYRGLLRVYMKIGEINKVFMYRQLLHSWKEIRDHVAVKESEFSPLTIDFEPVAPEDMYSQCTSIQ